MQGGDSGGGGTRALAPWKADGVFTALWVTVHRLNWALS